jgi:hypothetical protein
MKNFTSALNSSTKVCNNSLEKGQIKVWPKKKKTHTNKQTKKPTFITIPTMQNAHSSQDKVDLIAKTFPKS